MLNKLRHPGAPVRPATLNIAAQIPKLAERAVLPQCCDHKPGTHGENRFTVRLVVRICQSPPDVMTSCCRGSPGERVPKNPLLGGPYRPGDYRSRDRICRVSPATVVSNVLILSMHAFLVWLSSQIPISGAPIRFSQTRRLGIALFSRKRKTS